MLLPTSFFKCFSKFRKLRHPPWRDGRVERANENIRLIGALQLSIASGWMPRAKSVAIVYSTTSLAQLLWILVFRGFLPFQSCQMCHLVQKTLHHLALFAKIHSSLFCLKILFKETYLNTVFVFYSSWCFNAYVFGVRKKLQYDQNKMNSDKEWQNCNSAKKQNTSTFSLSLLCSICF